MATGKLIRILMLGIVFFGGAASVQAEKGERTEMILADGNLIEAPFLSNAVGIKSEIPVWAKVDDDEWIYGEDLILKEGIGFVQWTACNPELIDMNDCDENDFLKPEITFIDTQPSFWTGISNWVAYRQTIRHMGGDGRGSEPVYRLIPRSEWGANEWWRYAAAHNGGENETAQSSVRGHPYIEKIVETENGNYLWWPLEYQKGVKKIVIHHTATSGYLNDPKAGMRAIYLYHAKERGWGDIGYHYVIGPRGEIFVGRYGGDNVVGGHAGGHNIGTIGIAVMGDYRDSSVPEAARISLNRLVEQLTKKHSISKYGVSEFHGINMPNILGHRDLLATDCPGDSLYQEVIRMRGGVGFERAWGVEGDGTNRTDQNGEPALPKEVMMIEEPHYKFEIVSGNNNYTGRVGDYIYMTLALRNTGNVLWEDDTYLRSTRGWNNPYFNFGTSVNRDNRVAKMAQKTIEPGGLALFRFIIELTKPGDTEIDVFPVWGEERPILPIKIGLRVR